MPLLVACALAVAAPLAPAAADVVSEWNEAAASVPAPDGSIVQLRALATAHAAAFDAVNAFEKRYAFYLAEFQAPAGALPEAAAAAAMHGVLAALVPAEKARLDATLARLLAKIPDGAGKEDPALRAETVHNAFFDRRFPGGRAMKLHYYPETDSLYIELKDAPASRRGRSWKGLWSISTTRATSSASTSTTPQANSTSRRSSDRAPGRDRGGMIGGKTDADACLWAGSASAARTSTALSWPAPPPTGRSTP